MNKITLTTICLLLSSVTWFGQPSYREITPGKNTAAAVQFVRIARPFKGLVAGQSTKQDVERVLGQPVKKVSETLSEYRYAPKENDWYGSCPQVFVQYRQQSSVVERLELLCDSNDCRQFMVQPFQAGAKKFPDPDATAYEGKGTSKEKRLEYFDKPYYAAHTVILKDGEPVSCRMGFYSIELYDAAVTKARGQ